MDDPAGLTPQERAGYTAWILARGARLTTRDLALRIGLTERGARAMLCRLSRVVPIRQDVQGQWQAEDGERAAPIIVV